MGIPLGVSPPFHPSSHPSVHPFLCSSPKFLYCWRCGCCRWHTPVVVMETDEFYFIFRPPLFDTFDILTTDSWNERTYKRAASVRVYVWLCVCVCACVRVCVWMLILECVYSRSPKMSGAYQWLCLIISLLLLLMHAFRCFRFLICTLFSCLYTHTPLHTPTHTHLHTQRHTLAHKQTRTRSHAHARTHTYTHTYARTHTCTHELTYVALDVCVSVGDCVFILTSAVCAFAFATVFPAVLLLWRCVILFASVFHSIMYNNYTVSTIK